MTRPTLPYSVEHPSPGSQALAAPSVIDPDGHLPGAHTRDRVALPRSRDSLIGRERDLRRLRETLRTVRLLTLTGPGGVGKTRLAVAVAHEQAAAQPVFWVDLTIAAPGGSPGAVAAAIRVATGTKAAPPSDTVAGLGSVFGAAPALLVLDNADHVVKSCAEVVDSLMRLCPGLQMLVTSRDPLGVEGETTFEVDPLAVPARTDAVNGSTTTGGSAPTGPSGPAARAGACALFLDRAGAIDEDFASTAADRHDVLEICRRVGGMPLAIELAAALAARFGVPAVLDAVRRRGGHDDGLPLDWCYDLLPDDEARLFRRLAVFPSAFGRSGAAAVAGSSTVPQLDRLVEHWMVATEGSEDSDDSYNSDNCTETSYRLPSPLRSIAAEKLQRSADSGPAVTAHLAYIAGLAESLLAGSAGPADRADLDLLEVRLPDIRAGLIAAQRAHARLVSQNAAQGISNDLDSPDDPGGPDDPDDRSLRVALGVRLAGALVPLWYLRGHYREGQHWLEWAAEAGRGGPPGPLAAALRGAGRLAFLRCEYRLSRSRLEEALDLSTALDDGPAVIETLMWLGSVARETSDYAAAEELCLRARDLAAAAGDEESVLRADCYLAFASWLQLRFDDALTRCSDTMELAVRLGDAESAIWSLMSRGAADLYRGDLDLARIALTEALERSRRDRFTEGMAWSQHLMGVLRMRVGDRLGALALLREALAIHQTLGDRWRMTSVLDDLAALAATAADGSAAARFLGAADAIRRQIGVTPAPVEEGGRRTTLRMTRGLLRGKDFGAEFAAGAAADLSELAAALGTRPGHPATHQDRIAQDERLPTVDIRMLGTTAVRVDGRLLRGTDFGYAKPRELLFLLAAVGPCTKENIGAALWPGAAEGKVRGALHTALRELRRAVGSPALITFADGHYVLNPGAAITNDVAAFEAELAAARSLDSPREALPRLRQAVALYKGDFLGDGPRPAWADRTAVRLRQSFRDLLVLIGSNLAREGRWASATEVLLRAVHQDPHDEEARRLLVAAWGGVGDEAVAETDAQWLVDFAQTFPAFRVTDSPTSTLLYQQLVQRRRSSEVAGAGIARSATERAT